MNRQEQTQWSASGTLAAPLESVWEALRETSLMLSPQQRSELAQQKIAGLKTMRTTLGSHHEGRIHLEVDSQEHCIAIQGEWWYRGVYRLAPYTGGCQLVYEVYNVAPGMSRWAAQLVQGPQHARTMRAHLQSILRALGDQLACSFALLPDGSHQAPPAQD